MNLYDQLEQKQPFTGQGTRHVILQHIMFDHTLQKNARYYLCDGMRTPAT